MELLKITDRISCFPHSEIPLSADVGVIRCDDGFWIYDVGSTDETAAAINNLPGFKNVVLSHFHPDHAGNIERVMYDMLYAGAFTCKRLGVGTAVEDHLFFDNGIHLFLLPSSHAKGCVGLEYGDYAFLGDATYSMVKDGQIAYNTGILKEQIAVLKSLRADLLLLSHSEPFACHKTEVISRLEEIYALRNRYSSYIFPDGCVKFGMTAKKPENENSYKGKFFD